ncbi:hypothetical protein PHMEG_0003056 [Phytophthora megakarya]|uniref:Uncharacterized protein n=1 Tax=Phytophthora megakarya TaxID=4795 RepID=A0A225WYZ4_9STRA|nr:hypothetical protein PHMEG_0003056 [Phytophthora megakarya]
MTSANKAFASEGCASSEWMRRKCQTQVKTLSWFDSATREEARDIANLLFQTIICAEGPSKRLSDRACEVLTTLLIQYFPEVLERYRMYPHVSRIRIILVELGIEKTQVLAWSSEIQRKTMNKMST